MADQEPVLPELGTLAARWEARSILRARMQETSMPYMTRWISKVTMGAPSMKAISLNLAALEEIAAVWCPLSPYPRAPAIWYLRQEVGLENIPKDLSLDPVGGYSGVWVFGTNSINMEYLYPLRM